MLRTRDAKPRKAKKGKLNVITTRDITLPEQEEVDPEKVEETQTFTTGMLRGRRRRKK